MVDGFNGLNGRSGGFLGIVGGFGLGEVAGVIGGAVARGYFLAVAVGGEAGGVTSLVGLDCDGRGFTNGVVEGEGSEFLSRCRERFHCEFAASRSCCFCNSL